MEQNQESALEVRNRKILSVPFVIFHGWWAYMGKFTYQPPDSDTPLEFSFDFDSTDRLYREGKLPKAKINEAPFTWSKQELYDLEPNTRIDFCDL